MEQEFRIEHYRVNEATTPLRIVQDQRQESRKFLWLIPLLMLLACAFSPVGGMTIKGEHLDWFVFSVAQFGFLVSLCVVLFASSYTKEYQFTGNAIRVIEHRKGRTSSNQQYRFQPPLTVEAWTYKTFTDERGIVYSYSLFLEPDGGQLIELKLDGRQNMDRLLAAIRKHVEVKVTEKKVEGSWEVVVAALQKRYGNRAKR